MSHDPAAQEHERRDLPPAERVADIPRVLEALRLAVNEALLVHKRDGNPVATWRDGRVVWVAPEDIPIAAAPSQSATNR